MNQLQHFLAAFREALEEIERDLICAADGEKVGGNPVRHARCEGEAIGVRLTLNALDGLLAKPAPAAERHPMTKEYLSEAARAVEAKLPDNHGFLLLVAPYGEGEGRLVYVSTMRRPDALNLLKEFLLKAGAAEDWMKHIK